MGKPKKYELLLLLFKLFISFTDHSFNISMYTNINIFLKYIDKNKQYELLLILFKLFISFTDYTYNISRYMNIDICELMAARYKGILGKLILAEKLLAIVVCYKGDSSTLPAYISSMLPVKVVVRYKWDSNNLLAKNYS
jgi:hypothetical protein